MELPSSLPDQVIALVATERAIEEGLGRQADLKLTHATLHASLEAIQAQAGIQRQILETYLRQRAAEPTEPRSPIAPLLAEPSSPPMLSNLLAAYCAAFTFAANEYSVLIALGLHLYDYDPALRAIARKHLSTYAKAVRLLTHLLPGAIVEELDRQGLTCRCICPCAASAPAAVPLPAPFGPMRPGTTLNPSLASNPGWSYRLPGKVVNSHSRASAAVIACSAWMASRSIPSGTCRKGFVSTRSVRSCYSESDAGLSLRATFKSDM